VTKLPPSLQQRSDLDSIREDIAPYRQMTIDERSRAVNELCRWARDAIEASADPRKAWRWEDRRSAESLALCKRLVATSRLT
jgi:hypothetical protein